MSESPSRGSGTTPPGWYPDPWRVSPYRWWDGTSWTGNVSAPPSGAASDPSLAYPARFEGGMNVPSAIGGRLNATIPLVVLTIDDTLRLHVRWFVAMFSDFEVPIREIATAFRLSGRFMTRGVGFE